MITPQDKLSAEQEAERQYWEQVEAKARHHEQLSKLMTEAGLPPIHPTKETEIIGDILSAIAELEAGYPGQATKTLQRALKALKV
jgi:hypothetical protein